MCARSPRSWHTRHTAKPEVHGSSSHVQAWFRAGWKRVGERPPDLCPVGSLTAGTFPLSVPSLLSGVWKRLSPCLLWGPLLPAPPCPVRPCRCWQLHSPVIVCMWSVMALEAGVPSGGHGEGPGSRVGAPGRRHACTPASVHALNPSRPREGPGGSPAPTCPCCLRVPNVGHRGGGFCSPRRGDLGPRQKSSCLPRAGVQGASGHRLASRVWGCAQAAWEPEGPEVPTAGPGAQASLGPAVCVSRTSLHPPTTPAFPGHPQSSCGPGGSLWMPAPSPLSWAPASRADQGAAELSRGPRSPVPVDGWLHLLGVLPWGGWQAAEEGLGLAFSPRPS